jgi:RNA polymerase sigma-70 factor (ECF subfamily)
MVAAWHGTSDGEPIRAVQRHMGMRIQRAGTLRAPSAGGSESADARLLRELHEQHAVALLGFVSGLLDGDRVKAQDVVQETFLRAWRNPAVLAQANGSARGWLFTVARRIVIDGWRSARRRPEVVTAELPELPVRDGTQQLVDRQLVLAALRTLSAEHRAVLLECYFRGASVADAAKRLGVPPGTIKSRTHYALHALRDALHQIGGIA